MTAGSIEVRLLGPVRAWRDDQEIALGSAHRRAILSILAIRSNRAVSKAELIGGVWGEALPTNAVASLYTYVSGLRGALEPQRTKRSEAGVLTSAGSGYSLLLGSDALDVHVFEQRRTRAARVADSDPAAALAELDAAVALWRGTAFSGIDGPFAEAQRVRLDELRLDTLERRAALRLAMGGHAEVVAELRGLVCEHPLREGLRAVLMNALCRSGRSTEALEVFHDIRRLLAAEFGTEPGLALQRLHQRVRANDPALTARPAPRTAQVTSLRHSTVHETPPTLVGRDDELAVVQRAVTDVAEGRGGYLWLEGEQGAGKSAIVAAGLAAADGCRVVQASCDELRQRLPFGVLADCLGVHRSARDPRRTALANALRDEGSTDSGWTFEDSTVAVVEHFVGFVSQLCAEGPLVLVVDDAQWIDEASSLVWRRLAALTHRMPLLLIGVSRFAARRVELERLRRTVRGSRGEVITIDPLPENAAHALLTSLVGAAPSPRLRQVAARAGGNPLYLKETISALVRDRAVQIRGGVAEVDEDADAGIPPRLAAALIGRLRHLSPATTEALRCAALLGDEFALGDLAAVLDRPAESLARVVEEATTTGLLTDAGAVLVFRHPLVRQALYAGMPASIRAALHLQAAQALATACAPVGRVVEQLAATGSATASWMVTWLVGNVRKIETVAPEAALRLLQDAFDHSSLTDEDRDLLAAALTRLRRRRESGAPVAGVVRHIALRTAVAARDEHEAAA
ncbi:BTAD domain-containing putative transcriptional regulator [Lentzea sp. NPDC051213]|uniref:BTAD domain-containing putative transcriptional regulator n=1 Tax=Lentzea sp. NPDC051213 TaxID=3364126 RepID=UPI00379974D7